MRAEMNVPFGRLAVRLALCLVSQVPCLVSPPPLAAEEYPDFVEEVYLTPEEALKKVFPAADRVEREDLRLSREQRERVERRLGWRLADEPCVVYKGFTREKPDGFAVIAEEVGKYKPITFIVQASPDFKVERVEVLVYREARGAEVRKARFLRQFKGKSASSPLRINRDVINVTGATLSVRAMSAGVKRALCVLEEAYGRSR
jgi:Na+-translocating ferredoxin:NAD+ oxidoreductase RnfG subunit